MLLAVEDGLAFCHDPGGDAFDDSHVGSLHHVGEMGRGGDVRVGPAGRSRTLR